MSPQSTGTSAPTEIITRIIRTSELDESKTYRKSKTVFEQELQSGRDGNGGGGCHISSSIAFDNPNTPNSGVIIKELNEDGTSKVWMSFIISFSPFIEGLNDILINNFMNFKPIIHLF